MVTHRLDLDPLKPEIGTFISFVGPAKSAKMFMFIKLLQ